MTLRARVDLRAGDGGGASLTRLRPGLRADPALTWDSLQAYFVGRRMDTYLRPLPDHRLLYVKNPKAACSTILAWLDRMHTGEQDAEFENIHQQHRLPHLREVGRGTVLEMIDGTAFRFSFVRHPLRRFESVYREKFVAQAGQHRPKIMASIGLEPDAGAIPFEQFLAAVEQQDPMQEMDSHWRPQHINLVHPLITYDHVGHLETFTDDLEHIREAAGLPHVRLQTRNAAPHGASDSVYDGRPDLVRRVEALYAQDFELYGY